MLMKEGLGPVAVERIATALAQVVKDFDSKTFKQQAIDGLDTLELKERVAFLIDVLSLHLPCKFADCAPILKRIPDVWDRGDPDDPLRGFAAWPIIDYVAVQGIDDPELALEVLQGLTSMFSAEFAVRPFLLRHEKITHTFLRRWIGHPDEHVRRLVSEGTRPRLPWGIQLKPYIEDPGPSLPLLEKLRLDPSEYVRRSVANHLNDIGKDHPELLVDICREWQQQDQGKSDWVISHGTRTLVKAGHPAVFSLLGYTDQPKVSVEDLQLSDAVIQLGETLSIELVLCAKKQKQKIVVDYAVHHRKANGQTSAKVFKLKNLELNKGEKVHLRKSIPFKKITTRCYYSGEHYVAIHINGIEKARATFVLALD